MPLPEGFCNLESRVSWSKGVFGLLFFREFHRQKCDGSTCAIQPWVRSKWPMASNAHLKSQTNRVTACSSGTRTAPCARSIVSPRAGPAVPRHGRTKARHYPNVDKSQLFELGYIAHSSGHSRGSSVDLTLTDMDGQPLDMGTCFDFMDDAFPPR